MTTLKTLSETLERCLLCGSADVPIVVALEPIPIATPNFKVPVDLVGDPRATSGVPLDLHQCGTCGHVQVGEIGNAELQYRDYVYTTSLSVGLREHFAAYANAVLARFAPEPGALVVELGSNDGTLLSFFKAAGMRVLGVDPAERIAREATQNGIETLPDFFSATIARRIVAEHGPAAIVIANNMIANVKDLDGYAQGVAVLLDREGVFLFETQYGADVIERNLLDTVYHEHLSYFFAAPTQAWLRAHGMELIDFERVDTKGGSFRATARRADGNREANSRVAAAIAQEAVKGVRSRGYFAQLNDALAVIRKDLRDIVDEVRVAGRPVAGYGVSVGTTTLLAQFGLSRDIDFLIDDDTNKSERLAGPDYNIPVLPPAEVYARNPGAIVIFAWRYAEPIVAKHAAYLAAGGRFVIPLPAVRVIGG